jgi:hypothetical protein
MYDEHEKPDGTIKIIKEETCFLCKKESKNLVRHHGHFTGVFLGYACDSCNKKIKKPRKIKNFFRNLKGYNSHFIIKFGLKKFAKELKDLQKFKVLAESMLDEETTKPKKLNFNEFIKVLGKSKEKLFFIKSVILQDSYCHLPFSLSQLVKDLYKQRCLANSCQNGIHIKKHIHMNGSTHMRSLMCHSCQKEKLFIQS